jgi:hypothetical protein
LHDIENHPKFKAFYEQKVNTQLEMAKRIVGKGNEDKIVSILNMPESEYRNQQIDELAASLSPASASRLGGVLNALDEINADKRNQIDSAKKDFDRMQTEQKANSEKTAAERKATADKLFNDTLSNVSSEKGIFVFQKKEGDEEWNKGVEARVGFAKNLLFNEQKPDELIKAAFSAAALPGVIKSYQNALTRIEQLEAQVKGMTAAQPSLNGERANGDTPPPKNDKTPSKRGMIRNNLADAAEWAKELQTASQE